MLYEELAIEHTNNHAVSLIMSLKTVADPRILIRIIQGSSRYKASTPLFKRKSGYASYYMGPVLPPCSIDLLI